MEYDETLSLVSIHIPKTGGSSLLQILQQWFGPEHFHSHYKTPEGMTPLPPHLSGGDCVHGHFNSARGFGIDDVFPAACQCITMLRDPFDRFVSQWAYLHKVQDSADGHVSADLLDHFDHWFEARAAEQRQGRNSWSLVWHFPRAVRECPCVAELQRSFLFIGHMERFQAAVNTLAGILGKPTLAVPMVNTSLRDKSALERYRADFEQAFADEIDLYRACLDFEKRRPQQNVR